MMSISINTYRLMVIGNMEYDINYSPINVEKSTFKGGLSAKVHRWFRLTPSYAPDLVQTMIEKMECSPGSTILDPFSGASTTAIEGKIHGYNCIGFEINPFLHWVGKTCSNWNLDVSIILELKNKILNYVEKNKYKITTDNMASHGLLTPPIHNPDRWWNDYVIKDLLILKKAINEKIDIEEYKDFFLLAIAGVLVPDLSNVSLGKLQLHFIDRSNDKIDVMGKFISHLNIMVNDLVEIQKEKNIGKSLIINTNSTSLSGVNINDKINYVITSPPYPNRYSYVWNTRPHLYFFDFITSGKESSSLDKETIGGTWGTATSMLAKGIIEPEFDFLHKANLVVNDIRKDDNLMANYVMKYFNLIARQINVMGNLPQDNIKCAYVVGNSRIKKRYIETDLILSDIFNGLGYNIDQIHRFRKRNSGVSLYESIVYARK